MPNRRAGVGVGAAGFANPPQKRQRVDEVRNQATAGCAKRMRRRSDRGLLSVCSQDRRFAPISHASGYGATIPVSASSTAGERWGNQLALSYRWEWHTDAQYRRLLTVAVFWLLQAHRTIAAAPAGPAPAADTVESGPSYPFSLANLTQRPMPSTSRLTMFGSQLRSQPHTSHQRTTSGLPTSIRSPAAAAATSVRNEATIKPQPQPAPQSQPQSQPHYHEGGAWPPSQGAMPKLEHVGP